MKIIVAFACSFLFAATSFAGEFINLAYSVDAITKDGTIKVEIKCPFSETSAIYAHLQAGVPEIVPYVFWQLVHQPVVARK